MEIDYNTLNEAWFTDDFFRKVASGEMTRDDSQDDEILPGSYVFFNRTTNELEFPKTLDDKFRDISVYIPIGIVTSLSKNKKTLKCISMYAYQNELCLSEFDKSSDLNYLLKNEVESNTKDIVQICGGKNELKFYIPNQSEINDVLSSEHLNVILYCLELMSSYTQNKFKAYNLFLCGNLTAISEDKKEIIFYLGGTLSDVMSNRITTADKALQSQESSYSFKSVDEFFEQLKDEKLNIIHYDENEKEKEVRMDHLDFSLRYSITELKKRFSEAVYMDFSVVPFAVINLSE